MSSDWTSLEVAKLVASTLTPISVAILGLYLGRAAKRFEARQWANQKVVEKRLAVYDIMTPLLNDLYCYLCRIGNWKDLTPDELVKKKRDLDKSAYVYQPLFSPEFFASYLAFLNLCFRTWSGEGHDARILSDCKAYQDALQLAGRPWDPKWDSKFDKDRMRPREEVKQAYEELMRHFSLELGVGLAAPSAP